MSQYQSYTPEQLEEHFSHFLIDSWSYSKVSQFARNEKAFEMRYIYNHPFRVSATTVAGSAYHVAVEKYFLSIKEGKGPLDLTSMEKLAFEYIDNVPANKWKLQKTTPTVEQCQIKSSKTVASLLSNFIKEVDLLDIAHVLDVELRLHTFMTINGVDIPLPCKMVIDLVIQTSDGRTVIIDHKSKASFSDESEMALSVGCQAITYVNGYATTEGLIVDEVWFIENKYSTNRDGTPQLNCFRIEINTDVIRLYESLLYEPLRRMIQAVNDPDYVYIINESDNYIDKAELYEFWTKTMLAEVDDFNVNESKKELVKKRLKKIRDASLASVNPKVIREFKENASKFIIYDFSNKNMKNSEKIEHVLRSFGTVVNVAHQFDGYSSETYLLEVSAGTKITSVQKNKLDIANALNVPNVRIAKDLSVYDGKSFLCIESSKKRDRTLYWNKEELVGHKIPIGKDNLDNTIIWDLDNHSTPHMLICGATGSGKSVCIKSIVEYANIAGMDEIIILDPKYEFVSYNSHASISVINEIEEIEEEMRRLVEKMQELAKTGSQLKTLIVFDEFADALAASKSGKELDVFEEVEVGQYKLSADALMMGVKPQKKYKRVKTGTMKSLEENLKILLQKGRSLGFRIVSATQRASTKVITGDAKVNFPVQICFRVPKEIDSRVVLDEPGAEALAGQGDGLIRSPEYMDIVRFQAFYKP